MLYTFRHSPFHYDMGHILPLIGEEDEVLFFQDGVITAVEGNATLYSILEKKISVYVLDEDVIARGLSYYLSPKVNRVDYSGFVDLLVNNMKQIST